MRNHGKMLDTSQVKTGHKEALLGNLIPVFIGASIFTVLTCLILYISDYLLSLYLPKYQFSGQYLIALLLFFPFTVAFLLLGLYRGWDNWRYFIIAPVAIFLPLVFLSVSGQFLLGAENVLTLAYSELYCADSQTYCGKAFAYVFFSMCLRALPSVLIIPILYWFIYRTLSSSKIDAA